MKSLPKEFQELADETEKVREQIEQDTASLIPTTMEELSRALDMKGHEWREENSTLNEKTGALKVPPVTPRVTADILKEVCHFIVIEEDDPELSPLAVYDLDNGIYVKGERFIFRLCLQVENKLTRAQCLNVIHYLTVESPAKTITQDKNLVIMNNGTYNRETKELEPFSPDNVFISKIATNYNENAKEPIYPDWKFSDWLQELADGDTDKFILLWQTLASAIDTNNLSEVALFFVSESGSTGKSTFSELLMNLVGRANYASLKINEFEQDFKLASTYGKGLIVGDDNNPKDFNKTSENFKSAVTGDILLFNPKGDKPFTTRLNALVIQSMNGVPRFNDVSDGLLRRIRIVRFNHTYKNEQKNPKVKEKYIRDPKLLEWIAHQALQMEIEGFINTEESKESIRELELDNDKIKHFFVEVVPEMSSERFPVKFLFEYYLAWCDYELNAPSKMAQRTFTREAKIHAKELGLVYYKNDYYPSPYFSVTDENNLKTLDMQRKYYNGIKESQYQPMFIKEE